MNPHEDEGVHGRALRIAEVLAQMGARTSLITRVRAGEMGRRLTRVLHRCGIATLGVQHQSQPALAARQIRCVPRRARRDGSAERINPHLARVALLFFQPQLVYVSSDVVQRENWRSALLEVLNHTNGRVVLDATSGWESVDTWLLRRLLPRVSVLFASHGSYSDVCTRLALGDADDAAQLRELQREWKIEDLAVWSGHSVIWSRYSDAQVACRSFAFDLHEEGRGATAGDAVAIMLLGVLRGWSCQKTLDRALQTTEALANEPTWKLRHCMLNRLARAWEGVGVDVEASLEK